MTRHDLPPLLLVAAALMLLSGCGNKGALVMPSKATPEQPATEATTSADPTTPATEQPPDENSGEDDPGKRG